METAMDLAGCEHLVFICGHYEGVDERIREILNPLCLSIGNYILTNGALAAAVVIDTVTRLLPGSFLFRAAEPREVCFLASRRAACSASPSSDRSRTPQ